MDASTAKVSKRKRRKTRRNLDEIKKRCDRSNQNIKASKSQDVNKRNHMSSNRLTLFKKVIQSKTVVRDQVFNSLDVYKKKFKITRPQNALQTNSLHNRFKGNNTPDFNLTINGNTTQERAIENLTNDSIFLIRTSSEEPYSPSIHTTWSSNSQQNFSFYAEFIDNIPIFLKELVPQLLLQGEDLMKKNKLCLQQIWMETHMKKQKNYTFGLKCYTPINNQIVRRKLDVSPDVTYSPQFPEQDLETSSNSSLSILSETSSLQCSKSDSPEYIYYPHRLNE